MESKPEMKKRGVSSPDIADAVVLACVDAQQRLIPTFDPRRHIIADPWIARDIVRWRSIWARPHGEYVCLWMAVLPDGQRIVYHSLRERDTTVERFCTLLRRVTGSDPIGYTVLDPYAYKRNQVTDESWSDEFRRNGVSVTQGAADVQRGISALLSAFAPPFGAKPLVIAEDCADLVGEIQRWSEGDEGDEERYPLVSALWRLLVEDPRYREASARGVSRIEYPAPDVP